MHARTCRQTDGNALSIAERLLCSAG